MLFNISPYELAIILAVWVVLVLGVPSSIALYIWRKRSKKTARKP